MHHVVSNLAGRVRREKMQGRDYLVAPTVMAREGVLNGSKGPLLYLRGELAKSVRLWDHVPITLQHPERDGRPVSARQPDILNQSAIGVVLGSRMDGDKLRAECWFDVERTRSVAPEVFNKLNAGQSIECSTGLFTDEQATGGTFKNEEYRAIATNFRPDHLAILPNTRGACSCRDGCGVLPTVNAPVYTKAEWFNRLGRVLEQVETVCNESCDNDLLIPPGSLQ